MRPSELWAAARPAVNAIESSLIRGVGLYLFTVMAIVLEERSAGLLTALAQLLWMIAMIALLFASAVGRTGLAPVPLVPQLRGTARSALGAGATLQVVAMLLAGQWNVDISASAWANLGVLAASLAAVSVLHRRWTGGIHPTVPIASRTLAARLPWPVADPRDWVPADRPTWWSRRGIQPVYIGSSRSPRR